MAAISLTQEDNNTQCTTVAAGCSGRSVTAETPIPRDAIFNGSSGSAEASVILNKAEITVVAFHFASGAIGRTSWESGNFVAPLNITTAAAAGSTLDEIHVCRYSSACGNLASVGSATGLGISIAATGVKAGSTNISGAAQSSTNTTDKVVILYVFTNGLTHADTTFGVTPDQTITTPIDEPTVTTGPLDFERGIMRGSNRGVMRGI